MLLRTAMVILLAAWGCRAGIRVGVFGLSHPARVVVRAAPGAALRVTAGQRWLLLFDQQRLGLRAVGSEVDAFAERKSSSAAEVRVTGRDGREADFFVAAPGEVERRFRGTLVARSAAGRLSLVVSMDLETAVAGAVAAQMPPETPAEALKAMAVLARSYYAATGARHREWDFCDTVHCPLFRTPAPGRDEAWQATEATRGLVLTREGKPSAVRYTAACGGTTRAAEGDAAVECAACRRDPVLLRGRGEGHGIGVCQRGMAAMAAEGARFEALLKYYVPDGALRQQKDSRNGPGDR